MQTPDTTRAQIIAFVQAVIALVVSFGIDMSDAQQTAILGFAGAFLVILPLADAIIRNGRARIAAAAVSTVQGGVDAGKVGDVVVPRVTAQDAASSHPPSV